MLRTLHALEMQLSRGADAVVAINTVKEWLLTLNPGTLCLETVQEGFREKLLSP